MLSKDINKNIYWLKLLSEKLFEAQMSEITTVSYKLNLIQRLFFIRVCIKAWSEDSILTGHAGVVRVPGVWCLFLPRWETKL